MVVPSRASWAKHLDHLARQFRIERGGRLVAQKHARRGASARAIATRCCWPPESVAGQASALCASPTFSSSSMRPARRASFGHLSTVTSPSMTFSIAVRCGNSWKFWNTMPVCRRSRWICGPADPPPGESSAPRSPMRTVPEVGISSRLTQRSSVLLPPPEGPTSAVTRAFGDGDARRLRARRCRRSASRCRPARSCARLQEAAVAVEALLQPHLQRRQHRTQRR